MARDVLHIGLLVDCNELISVDKLKSFWSLATNGRRGVHMVRIRYGGQFRPPFTFMSSSALLCRDLARIHNRVNRQRDVSDCHVKRYRENRIVVCRLLIRHDFSFNIWSQVLHKCFYVVVDLLCWNLDVYCGIFLWWKVDIHVQMSRPVSLAYCIDFLPFTLLLLIFISLFNPSSCNFVQSHFFVITKLRSLILLSCLSGCGPRCGIVLL